MGPATVANPPPVSAPPFSHAVERLRVAGIDVGVVREHVARRIDARRAVVGAAGFHRRRLIVLRDRGIVAAGDDDIELRRIGGAVAIRDRVGEALDELVGGQPQRLHGGARVVHDVRVAAVRVERQRAELPLKRLAQRARRAGACFGAGADRSDGNRVAIGIGSRWRERCPSDRRRACALRTPPASTASAMSFCARGGSFTPTTVMTSCARSVRPLVSTIWYVKVSVSVAPGASARTAALLLSTS